MFANIIAAVCFSVFALVDAKALPSKCIININTDLATPQPLYLYANTTEFISTNPGSNDFTINHKQQIELYCSGGFRPPYFGNSLIATCIGGDQFSIGNKTLSLRNLFCKMFAISVAKETNRTCFEGNMIEIGFNVRDNLLPLMEICHNTEAGSTKWSHYRLRPQNKNHQRYVENTDFSQDEFYKGLQLSKLYTRDMQRITFATILGSQEIADKLVVNKSANFFLARGHLAARADYVFSSHVSATMHYINCAPQWQAFNGGNWNNIENSVRNFIELKNLDTDVYTGTHDILTYPDINGKFQKIYLAPSSGASRVPVPKFYYKVVIAKKLNAGIVLIGVNDAYATMARVKSEYIICPDVSDKVKFIDLKRISLHLSAGYSYACTVEDFRKVVKNLPELPKVVTLLV